MSSIVIAGDTSGTCTLQANAVAGTTTLTLPTTSGTLYAKAGGGAIGVADGGTGATTLTGVLKGNGTSAFTAAVAGTDYLAPPSGTAILKANSGGALANATAGTDYVAPGGALGTPSSGTLTNCTGYSASNLTTGTLPAARLPTGSILQAIQATNNTLYTISGSGTFTGLSITITPTSSSSKFLLIANIGQVGQSSGNSAVVFSFARNGSNLNYMSGGTYNGMVGFVNNDTNAGLTTGPTITYVDSPATTSSITYTVIYQTDGGTKWVGRRGLDALIAVSQQFQVLEIA